MRKHSRDIGDLKHLLKEIDMLFESYKYEGVVKEFDLGKKLVGPLGEAYAVVEIDKKKGVKSYNKSDGSIEKTRRWKGGQNRGYDIETDDGKKIQVKSSYDGHRFQIMSIKMKKSQKELIKKSYEKVKKAKGKIVTSRKFRLPKKVLDHFRKEFDKKYEEVDYWFLVWSERRKYFIIPNKKMKKFVSKAYEDYIRKRKHNVSFHYGISRKTKNIQIIFGMHKNAVPKKDSVAEQILKYDSKWW